MKKILLFISLIILLSACKKEKSKDDILKEKIGQMLIVGFEGTSLNPDIYNMIKNNNIGGVILFDKNISNPDSPRNIVDQYQLQKLTTELQNINKKYPLFISIDQEGGTVARLMPEKGFINIPSAQYINELNNNDSSSYYAHINAKQLKELGINMNFVPCIDLNLNPENPIIGLRERSFSDNPEEVTKQALNVIDEHNKEKILTSLKHFPGHGSSKTDSHLGFTDVSDTFDEIELIPYKNIIKENKAKIIMVSHLFNNKIDSVYPASLSKKTINGLLKDKLDFKGIVATDDMNMGAITNEYSYETALDLAINAGVDLIIIGNNSKKYDNDLVNTTIDVIFKLTKDGKIKEQRIDEAFMKIIALKKDFF